MKTTKTYNNEHQETMNYQKLISEAKAKNSVDFEFKGEKFKLFIDWENDLCLTHFYKNGWSNAWCVYGEAGLKRQLSVH